MDTISIEQKTKSSFISSNKCFIAKKEQQVDLDDFLKGTISGDELVKYVCDRLDEKYNGKNRYSSIQ